jgi:lantibiotic modifying enzyme
MAATSAATMDLCLDTCDRIVSRLDDDAFWHEGRCNWIGGEAVDPARGQVGLSHSALGPSLYAGTSGIALFLAECDAAQDDSRARELALGAIRHALSSTELVPNDRRLGLYAGWLGIAFAAARIGVLLGDASLVDEAAELVRDALERGTPSLEFDLVSGRAGAILAVLCVSEAANDESLVERATLLGDELLESAESSERGVAWASPEFPDQPCLTGLSHGAAGAAYVLLELAAATGKPRFREAAEAGFAYERSWFDADTGNWPDLRDQPRGARNEGYPLPCLAFWCHGAPGIALSRLRAAELLGDDTLRREAAVGLATTRETIADAVETGIGNFSLCHGIAGNADVLLEGERAGLGEASDLDLLTQAAELGAERYARAGRAWPCGTHAAETPSLMLGLAGIGLFYLRLANPTVPSVLAISAERAARAA